MVDRKQPIETNEESIVKYPSSLFSLEKIEIYPYERFAYNILSMGIDALHNKKLPLQLTVNYLTKETGFQPWVLNAQIKTRHQDNKPISYEITLPELLPCLLSIFSNKISYFFFTKKEYINSLNDDHIVISRIANFIEGSNLGIQEYKKRGLAYAIRCIYNFFGTNMNDLHNYVDDFDLISKYIAYHEIAHAYTMETIKVEYSPAESSALELIADLVAITWVYTGMIKNTPDSDEYRKIRGLSSFSETIFENSILCINALSSIFVLFAIAGAQQNNGKLTLEGNIRRPHSLLRINLQLIHLRTLILSNFDDQLSEVQKSTLNDEYKGQFEFICKSGIITKGDAALIEDRLELENIEKAVEIIENNTIYELKGMVDFLRIFKYRYDL